MLNYLLVFVLQISFAYCESGSNDTDSNEPETSLPVIIGSTIGSFVLGMTFGCISTVCIVYCVYRGFGIGHKVQLSLEHDPPNHESMVVDNSVDSSTASTAVRYVRDNSGANNTSDDRDVSSSFEATMNSNISAPKKPPPPPVSLKPSRTPVLRRAPSNSSDDLSDYELPISKSKSLQRGLVSVGVLTPVAQGTSKVRKSLSLDELKTFGLATEHLGSSVEQYGTSPPSEHYYTADIPKPPNNVVYMNIGPKKAE